MSSVTSPYSVAASLADLWSPVVVSEIESARIKVAKVKGELGWHTHDGENKIFMVLKGQLKIEMDAQTILLNQGEMYIVPEGVRNNPSAVEECHIMFIEPKSDSSMLEPRV